MRRNVLVGSLLLSCVIIFNGCSVLPDNKYKSCSFDGECYSISEADKDKALDECKAIALENSKSSFVFVKVAPESCN